MPIDPEKLARWRLILGKSAEEPLQQMSGRAGQPILGGDQRELDEALEAIYSGDEIEKNEWERDSDDNAHGAVKGRTFPKAGSDPIIFPQGCGGAAAEGCHRAAGVERAAV
jgi:hypothetical protein